MQLSVIIPCYNEENRIVSTLRSICVYLNKKYDYEIIIVDDGSKDATVPAVQEFIKLTPGVHFTILKNKVRMGKGFSVRKGMLIGEGNYLLFSDADLSTPIQEIDKLSYWLDSGYDIAIGSRALKGSQIIVHQFFIRETMGKIFNKLVRVLLLSEFPDTQCGFKLFNNPVAKKVFSLGKIHGFCFDVEVLCLAKELGFKIRQVPIKWINSPTTSVHALSDSIRMLTDLLKIRHHYSNKKRDSSLRSE